MAGTCGDALACRFEDIGIANTLEAYTRLGLKQPELFAAVANNILAEDKVRAPRAEPPEAASGSVPGAGCYQSPARLDGRERSRHVRS